MSQATKSTTPIPSRRALLAGAPAVAAAALAAGGAVNIVAVAMARPSGVDPIFAVIAEHRAIMRAWRDAFDMEEMTEHGTPEREAACAAIDAECEREETAMHAVLTAQPTTIAGVVALLEHVGQREYLGVFDEGEGEGEERQSVLTTWNEATDQGHRRTAQDFPLRLAATIRSLLDVGVQS
jgi:hypothetical protein